MTIQWLFNRSEADSAIVNQKPAWHLDVFRYEFQHSIYNCKFARSSVYFVNTILCKVKTYGVFGEQVDNRLLEGEPWPPQLSRHRNSRPNPVIVRRDNIAYVCGRLTAISATPLSRSTILKSVWQTISVRFAGLTLLFCSSSRPLWSWNRGIRRMY